MNDLFENKFIELKSFIEKLESCAIAFSGGVDSTLLLFSALEALPKEKIKVITIQTPAVTNEEIKDAINITKAFDIKPEIISMDNVKIINSNGNDSLRCYFCKKALFSKIKQHANESGIQHVLEGTNKSDLSGHRPGIKALEELEIISPFLEVNLYKEEIRKLSKILNLPVWNKPASACLVSRFPYNVTITNQEIQKVAQGEDYLKHIGFAVCRVRNFGEKCIIEVAKEKVNDLIELKHMVEQKFKNIGFKTIEINQNGYLTGNMDNVNYH